MSPTFSSLEVRNYRVWFAGALVSNIGTWMGRVGQDWLVLTVLTAGSATALGIVTGLQFLPFLLLSPLAGLAAGLAMQPGAVTEPAALCLRFVGPAPGAVEHVHDAQGGPFAVVRRRGEHDRRPGR